MPKRGGRNCKMLSASGARYTEKRYDEHDDRDRKPSGQDLTIRSGSNRRVSFKTTAQGRQNNNVKLRSAEMGIRARLEDDDDMSELVQASKMRKATFRRRGSPIPKSLHARTKGLIENASGWFQVLIPYGNKYEKDFILRTLLQAVSPEIFIPHYWKSETTCVLFYVDDYKMAKILASVDRTIDLPNGFKMIIKVRNGVPPVQIDANLKELMATAMDKRYNPSTKALDLSRFHADEILREVFCPLFRPPIMLSAIDIIAEKVPDLVALSLDNNKIQSLDHLKCIATKLPNLQILHLADNKISAPGSLDAIKQTNIVDIVLKGNPLRNRYRDDAVYVSEIRRRLPKLQKLDGLELPPQIGFDIEADDTKAPAPQASFFSDPACIDMAKEFLQAFYAIYDSDDRQPLENAYHDQAMFSLTASYHTNPTYRLSQYLQHNRNLCRMRDLNSKMNQLKNGKFQIVSFLKDLPATEHDPHSFAVDLTLFTEKIILLTVTGIFREKQMASTSRSEPLLRSFHRSLVITKKVGGGFCIINDMLHVNNLTMAQVKTAFKPIAPVPVTTGPVQAPVVPTPTSALAAPTALDDTTKLRMIQEMANGSQMNLEWSKLCLEQTNWNFEQAARAFTEAQAQGKIPKEAFVK